VTAPLPSLTDTAPLGKAPARLLEAFASNAPVEHQPPVVRGQPILGRQVQLYSRCEQLCGCAIAAWLSESADIWLMSRFLQVA
jgi:hypothetical protein